MMTRVSSTDRSNNTPLRVLANVRYVAELPHEIQREIAKAAVPRRYKANQVIFLEGEPPDALYILELGWVKSIRMSREGREQAMLFLKPGEVFGDIAVFTGTPYPGTVLALEPVSVWSIEREQVLALVSRYPEFAQAVIRRLGERVLHFIDLVDDLTLRSVEARLAHTLLKHTVKEGDHLIVPRRTWTTIDEMAVRLGTVRDVLGRILRNLENEGLLRVERDAITILEPEILAERGKR